MERLTIDEIIEHCNRNSKNYERNVPLDVLQSQPLTNTTKLYWEHKQVSEYLKELKQYRDLEEQGRLVKLPCKVGNIVWQIMVVGVQGKNIQYDIFRAVVTKISADYQMNFLLSTITEDEKRYRNEVTSTAIGDTMFFTKSEAEAKLKELRGEENDNS